MWRNSVVLAVCYVITITLAVFAGAELFRVSLMLLPLFMLAWLALTVDPGRSSSREAKAESEVTPVRRRHDPTLDRIASMGLLFTLFHAPQLRSPTRASNMSTAASPVSTCSV